MSRKLLQARSSDSVNQLITIMLALSRAWCDVTISLRFCETHDEKVALARAHSVEVEASHSGLGICTRCLVRPAELQVASATHPHVCMECTTHAPAAAPAPTAALARTRAADVQACLCSICHVRPAEPNCWGHCQDCDIDVFPL